ncbi:hypothetical protein SUGI_1015970 [Cryptomeria japonica]|nr:hypothetical protein SUGI_1015970 [Cryptomeria japonica]
MSVALPCSSSPRGHWFMDIARAIICQPVTPAERARHNTTNAKLFTSPALPDTDLNLRSLPVDLCTQIIDGENIINTVILPRKTVQRGRFLAGFGSDASFFFYHLS